MANRLKMATIDTIQTLRQQGWSLRRIARTLGVHRDTIARHLQQVKLGQALTGSTTVKLGQALTGSEEAKLGQALTGSDQANTESDSGQPASISAGDSGTNPAEALTGSTVPATPRPARQASLCEPLAAVIQAKLDQGLTAQRIYQDLVTEHGFTGKYHSVRRFVRRLAPRQELPFRRLECGPGEEAQVDFGQGAFIQEANGHRRRPHVFRIVLSYSRKAYSEVVPRQTTEAFLRCLENAFWHFGGVPQRLVLDNLRAAVTKADWFDPELNPKVRSFGQHYSIALLPTKPYTPRHKGKVEKGVDYVQDNALKGRLFQSLDAQNHFLLDWEQTVADTRIHGTTRRQVGALFAEVERAALQRLPLERFPCFVEGQRIVHRDGHVEIDRAYYSVPPEHLGRTVWVRWDSRLVRIFTVRMEQIAVHVKHERGRFSTQPGHLANRKISGIERGKDWLLNKARCLGPHSSRWAEAMMQERGIEGVRVLQGMLALARRHPNAAIEHACDIALSHGAYHLRSLRALVSRPQACRQEPLPFLDEHPLIRDLSAYGQFVHDTFPTTEVCT
jgi:transposase